MDISLHITLFGPMQVLVQGQPFPRLRSRKTLWLLALLTLRSKGVVSREWLAETLWPDVDQSQAFANLRPVVSELRQALGSEGQRLQSPNRHTLFLDLTGAQVDLLTFDAAIASKKTSLWEQAVSLYQGPLLEGCMEEWVVAERNARELGYLQILHKLADIALVAAEYDTAIAHFRHVVSIAPLDEVAQRGSMEALARRGDINAALQIYRSFIELLKADPKAVPEPETVALYSQLRNDARQKASLPPSAVEPSTPIVLGNLSRPLTELIGREEEQVEVIGKLKRHRLVTLTGVGGIGKTRLAIAVATTIASDYPDGAWMVSLETVTEEKQILALVAAVFEVKDVPSRSLLQNIIAHLKKKQLLLVLDNCEHLLRAVTPVVSHLLQECVTIRILATSRESLAIAGESTWAVPALAVPDLEYLPTSIATLQRVLPGYESVQLFLERAQSVQNGFLLTGSNALTIAKICYQLEGIPLAIELAAARVRILSVDQISKRLQDYLAFLTGGGRASVTRQQTLRGTLDWSYGLLSDSEKVLLSRLSVFVGGWTLEAAEGICSDETIDVGQIDAGQIAELLSSLVDKSLVLFVEEKLGERYRLLEMVRQYAFERLKESSEAESIRIKHRDWFIQFAPETLKQRNAVERQESEYGNLRQALIACESDPGIEAVEGGLQLVGVLWRFWYMRGYFSEGRKYTMQALLREGAQVRTVLRADALIGANAVFVNQGEDEDRRAWLEESLSIYRELGDRNGIALALNPLANLLSRQGNYLQIKKIYEESLSIFRDLDNQAGVAWSLGCLAKVSGLLGDYEQARSLFEESLCIRRTRGDKHSIATSLHESAEIIQDQGDYDTAGARYEESLHFYRSAGNKAGMAWVFYGQGNLRNDQGDTASARVLHEESLKIFRELEDPYGIATVLGCLGYGAFLRGEYASAWSLCMESLELCRERKGNAGIAWALNQLGRIACLREEFDLSRTLYTEAFCLYREMANPKGVAESLEGIAALYQALTEFIQAVRLRGLAHALREKIGVPVPLSLRETLDQKLEQCRVFLDSNDFAIAWEEGSAMGWEQIRAMPYPGHGLPVPE